MTDDQTPLEQQDIPTEGTLIAIPISWAHSPSGCVEWRLVDWTVPDDDGQRLPVWADVAGDTGAWGDDYALRRPQDDDWCFPDGERCDDENLSAAFARRKRHRADASSGGNDTGRKLRRAPARPDADMKPTKNKQGSDAPGKLMMALVQFEDPNQLCAGMRALRVEGFETKFLDRWADPEGSRMVWVLAWITIAADRERGFLSYVWDIVDEFSGMPDEAGPTTAADLIAYEDPAYWNLSKTYRKHWLAMTTAHAAFMTAVAD